MCGIVGLIALGTLGKKEEEKRQKFMKFASMELMLRTDERGKDATGAVILFADGNYAGIKRGEEATAWFAKFGNGKDKYGSLLKVWDEYEEPVKIYLGHCRKGTVGDKEDNENNHPIKIQNIIGIHNGVIRNDKEIQEHLGCKRDGKVDSEMIFRLMHYLTNEGKEPWTMPMLEQLIARLTGAWAVMALNADNLHQMPMFRDSRPIELILIKELSLLVVVSDIKFWSSFHFQYERTIFYNRLKGLPSLLEMGIEKKSMADDSAAIIDLDVHCTKDTTIEDIWEWKKIPRDNKIWTSSAALRSNYANGSGSYNGGQSMAKTTTVDTKPVASTTTTDTTKASVTESKDDADLNRRRVYNGITKKYELKGVDNPKTLKAEESVIIPVDSTTEAETKVTESKTEEKKSTFETDFYTQETSTDFLLIEDLTDYEAHQFRKESEKKAEELPTVNKGSEDNGDVIDVVAEVIDESEVAITEVDMTVDNVELMALATRAYNELPNEDKGYSDMETLLTDISIKDEAKANELGIKVVSNRVAGVQWVRGFVKGWVHRDKELKPDEEKTKIREKHISGLKSMVIMLASYFSKSREHKLPSHNMLKDIASDHLSKRPKFDMNNLTGIFNAHEEGKIKDAEEVIKAVANNVD